MPHCAMHSACVHLCCPAPLTPNLGAPGCAQDVGTQVHEVVFETVDGTDDDPSHDPEAAAAAAQVPFRPLAVGAAGRAARQACA